MTIVIEIKNSFGGRERERERERESERERERETDVAKVLS
jgi:hypothetical protein